MSVNRQYPKTISQCLINAAGSDGGLALHFYFTQKKSEAGKYEEPFLDISINENLPKSAPRDYSIRSGSGA